MVCTVIHVWRDGSIMGHKWDQHSAGWYVHIQLPHRTPGSHCVMSHNIHTTNANGFRLHHYHAPPKSTSQPTQQYPNLFQSSSHPSVSPNIISSCPQTTPTTPDWIPIRPHQSLTRAPGHPSPPIMASTTMWGIRASVPVHWTCNWTEAWHRFSSNPDLVSPYGNNFMLLDSLRSCAYYSCTHPWFFALASPLPPTLGISI